MRERAMRKNNKSFGHLFKDGSTEALPWEKDDSHWQRISWLEVCHLAASTSLSVSDCTKQCHDLFQPQQQHGSACREAVLDTNLSSANKSQTHQPECYSWQSALVDYERQIVQQGQRTTRGILQQPLQWLVNVMFAFCVIFTYCGFLFLIWSLSWSRISVVCCRKWLILSYELFFYQNTARAWMTSEHAETLH